MAEPVPDRLFLTQQRDLFRASWRPDEAVWRVTLLGPGGSQQYILDRLCWADIEGWFAILEWVEV